MAKRADMQQGRTVLTGSTSHRIMTTKMRQLDRLMTTWSNGEKLDVVGAYYALLFHEFHKHVYTNMVQEEESNPQALQDAETSFVTFLAGRLTMDVISRIFPHKVFMVQVHKLADTTKDLEAIQTLETLYKDHTTNGNT